MQYDVTLLVSGVSSTWLAANNLLFSFDPPSILNLSSPGGLCVQSGVNVVECLVNGGDRRLQISGLSFGNNISAVTVMVGTLPCSSPSYVVPHEGIVCTLPATSTGGFNLNVVVVLSLSRSLSLSFSFSLCVYVCVCVCVRALSCVRIQRERESFAGLLLFRIFLFVSYLSALRLLLLLFCPRSCFDLCFFSVCFSVVSYLYIASFGGF